MKRLVLIVLVAVPLRAQETLPPSPALTLMLKACVQCHDLHWIAAQRKSEAAWRRTVSEMIWRGAPVQPGENDLLTRYLVENFGNDTTLTRRSAPPSPAERERVLPPGPGRDLVAANCVQCHDLALTTTQHKSLAEWRQTVDAMVRLGTKLNGTEIQTVARYLSKAFPR